MREAEDEEDSGGSKGAVNSLSHSLPMPPVSSLHYFPLSLLTGPLWVLNACI